MEGKNDQKMQTGNGVMPNTSEVSLKKFGTHSQCWGLQRGFGSRRVA